MKSETRKGAPRISRRTLLGGASALIGLPFLESALPRAARAQATTAPVRLLYVYVPCGIQMQTYRPTGEGAGYTLSPMLAGMAALKQDFSVVTGLANGNIKNEGGAAHAPGTSAFITCVASNPSESDIRASISVDQLAAQKLGKLTRIPSLQLAVPQDSFSDKPFGAPYMRTISWASAKEPLPNIVNPKQAFDRLFMGSDAGESAAATEKRRAYDKSVLDAVLGDVQSLKTKLAATDKQKLDQYLNGVREVEVRLEKAVTAPTCAAGSPPKTDKELDYPGQVKAMMDVIALAFACDATRICTFMLGNGASFRQFPFLGINEAHHLISHHGNKPQQLDKLAKIGKWEIDQLGYLMQKLKELPDSASGQNVLFNTALFFSSEISDGDGHNHDNMPIILGGHGGGYLKPGRHVVFPTNNGKEKVANLLVTMLAAAGVPGATLGDSTGTLQAL